MRRGRARRLQRAVPLVLLSLGVPAASQTLAESPLIERIEILNNQFLQRETLLFYVSSKPGDPYDERKLREDFRRLWDTGFLDDLRIEAVDGPSGKVVSFMVTERKRIQIVDFRGSKELTTSTIEDELKKRDAQVKIDTFYDPPKARKVESIIKEMLAAEGPALRHGQARGEEHRRLRPAALVHDRRRAQGEGQGDRLRRQRGLHGRDAAREDEEDQAAGLLQPELARRQDHLHRGEVARGPGGSARRPRADRGLLPEPRLRHGARRPAAHQLHRRQAGRLQEEAGQVHEARDPGHRGRRSTGWAA